MTTSPGWIDRHVDRLAALCQRLAGVRQRDACLLEGPHHQAGAVERVGSGSTPRVGRADPGERRLNGRCVPSLHRPGDGRASGGATSPGGIASGGAATMAGSSGAGGAAAAPRAARAARPRALPAEPGVSALYCDLTTAICTCSLLCLDCRSARTAAACSAAVLASAADLAEAASRLGGLTLTVSVVVHLRRHLGAITR